MWGWGLGVNWLRGSQPYMYMLLYLYSVVVFQFQCCEFDQRISGLASFCYSDMDYTIVSFGTDYLSTGFTSYVSGEFGGFKVYTDIK